jgi:hypothetical protein
VKSACFYWHVNFSFSTRKNQPTSRCQLNNGYHHHGIQFLHEIIYHTAIIHPYFFLSKNPSESKGQEESSCKIVIAKFNFSSLVAKEMRKCVL